MRNLHDLYRIIQGGIVGVWTIAPIRAPLRPRRQFVGICEIVDAGWRSWYSIKLLLFYCRITYILI